MSQTFDDATVARFWAKVDKRGPDECWPWLGWRNPADGRGGFTVADKNVNAPRVALMMAGTLPPGPGLLACHSCDNPPCVNPAHLWWGTYAENARDRSAKGRSRDQKKTHCPKGHPLTPGNLCAANLRRGARYCLTCRRAAERAWELRERLKRQRIQEGAI